MRGGLIPSRTVRRPVAGAVARLITDKLHQDSVSVLDFMLPADVADLALATPLRDQRANIQAAIDSGAQRIYFPAGAYRVEGAITLRDGLHLVGDSSGQTVGASIRFAKNDGTHCFTSNAANFLSFCRVENFEILNTVNVAGAVASGDAFHLFGVTNNCGFKNLFIRNFGGSGFYCGKQTTNLADKTAIQNCLFECVFITSCGGYSFDVDGYVNAAWVMCDLNSCATGYFRFTDGTSNQTQINVYSLWIEGTRSYAAATVFDMVDTKSQMLNIFGANCITSVAGTTRIIKSTTTACRVNAVGVTGFGWTYFHENTPDAVNTTLSTPSTHFYQARIRQLTVGGPSPILDVFQETGGTVNQRFFRWAFSGNKLLLSARNDDGSSARSLATWNHSTGEYAPSVDNSYNSGAAATRWANTYSTNFRPGAGTVTWTSGAGSPEAAVVGAIGSMYTRTDGGAGTTLYVKESGAGNTGWVAK